jgi:hypothetical protein
VCSAAESRELVKANQTEDSFAMTCQLSNPSLVATIAGSRAMGGRVGLRELAGARGHLLADHVHGWVHLVRGTERLTLSVPSPVPTVRETLDAFVRALREGTSFPISIEDGLRAVAIADAAYRSAERGGERGGRRILWCALIAPGSGNSSAANGTHFSSWPRPTFEVGAEVVGTPHPIGIFLAGCRECLGEWELQASGWSHQSSRRASDPIALDQTVCPRGQNRGRC